MKRILSLALPAACFFLNSCSDLPLDTAAATRAEAIRGDRAVGRQRVITFPEVRDVTAGTAAEHDWTDANYPGSRWDSVRVLEDSEGRVYHCVTLRTARGREQEIYFDVTNWAEAASSPGARIR